MGGSFFLDIPWKEYFELEHCNIVMGLVKLFTFLHVCLLSKILRSIA